MGRPTPVNFSKIGSTLKVGKYSFFELPDVLQGKIAVDMEQQGVVQNVRDFINSHVSIEIEEHDEEYTLSFLPNDRDIVQSYKEFEKNKQEVAQMQSQEKEKARALKSIFDSLRDKFESACANNPVLKGTNSHLAFSEEDFRLFMNNFSEWQKKYKIVHHREKHDDSLRGYFKTFDTIPNKLKKLNISDAQDIPEIFEKRIGTVSENMSAYLQKTIVIPKYVKENDEQTSTVQNSVHEKPLFPNKIGFTFTQEVHDILDAHFLDFLKKQGKIDDFFNYFKNSSGKVNTQLLKDYIKKQNSAFIEALRDLVCTKLKESRNVFSKEIVTEYMTIMEVVQKLVDTGTFPDTDILTIRVKGGNTYQVQRG